MDAFKRSQGEAIVLEILKGYQAFTQVIHWFLSCATLATSLHSNLKITGLPLKYKGVYIIH